MANKPIHGPTIALAGGGYFNFEDPKLSEIKITDIAHALSHICRFTGHCVRYYSVAEHSVLTSYAVPHRFAFEALMHDAAEAYIGDIAKPLKQLLPDYAVIENRVETEVLSRFNLCLPLSPEVKQADRNMLRTEQAQVMQNRDNWTSITGSTALDTTVRFLPPNDAREAFLKRFHELEWMQQVESVAHG